eukprot:2407465-Pyramimonas_sp.AAC.2
MDAAAMPFACGIMSHRRTRDVPSVRFLEASEGAAPVQAALLWFFIADAMYKFWCVPQALS